MVQEEEINKLLAARKETKNTDYKGPKSWGEMTKDEKHGIIKDVLGMSNTRDGGTLIFGVRDDDCEFVGVPEDELTTFDQTDINNVLVKFTEPKHYCTVQIVKIDERPTIVIEVPEFNEEPVLCKRDQNSTEKNHELILKRGALYIRNDKAETVEINTVEDMRELLGRALRKKGDWLLREIKTILEGRPVKAVESDGGLYDNEIKEANEEIVKKIGNDFARWEVYAYPIPYQTRRVSDITLLKKLVTDNAVSTGGWAFPFANEESSSYFDNGWQSFISKDIPWVNGAFRVKEGFRVYDSGLFVWKGILRIGLSMINPSPLPEGSKVVFYNDIIRSVTDFLKFIKRVFEGYEPETAVLVRVIMKGVADSYLSDTDMFMAFRLELFKHRSVQNIIYAEKETTVAELNGSYLDLANEMIRRLLLYFNADGITYEAIREMQKD